MVDAKKIQDIWGIIERFEKQYKIEQLKKLARQRQDQRKLYRKWKKEGREIKEFSEEFPKTQYPTKLFSEEELDFLEKIFGHMEKLEYKEARDLLEANQDLFDSLKPRLDFIPLLRRKIDETERKEKEEFEKSKGSIRIEIRSPTSNSTLVIGGRVSNLLAKVILPRNIKINLRGYMFKWWLNGNLKNGNRGSYCIHEQLSGKSQRPIHPDFASDRNADLIVSMEDKSGNVITQSDPVAIILEAAAYPIEIWVARNEFFIGERISLKAYVNLGFTEFRYVWYISEFGDGKKVKHRHKGRSTDSEVPYSLPASELGAGKFEVYFGVIIDIRLPADQRVKWSQPVVITVKERGVPSVAPERGREPSQTKDEFDAGLEDLLDKFRNKLGGKD